MLSSVVTLLLTLISDVLPSSAQLPRPYGEETLGIAGGAVKAVLARERKPLCSVILLTDGTTSANTVFKELERLQIPLGLALFEAKAAAKERRDNASHTELSWMVGEARRLRLISGCVTVLVVSDDPAFLAASAEWSLKGRLLTWSNKLLAVTRRPLQDLGHLYSSFSLINSMLVIIDTSSSFPRCDIYVHPPYRPPEAQVVRVASWSTIRGLTMATHLQLFPEKFSKFEYRPTLVTATEEYPSYVEKGPGWKPDRLIYKGPVIQLLQLLADNFNFTYTYIRPPDGKFGNKEPDGTWTGMVGMVGRKEADMGIGAFTLTAVRFEMVDYMRIFVDDAVKMIGGLGRPEVAPWGFLLPLGPLVWAAILATLLVVPAVALLMLFCLPRRAPQRHSWMMDNTFLYIRVLLQQGYSPEPGELSWERLLLGSWMLITLIFVRCYDGNLMSMLAVRYIPQPYQYLRDVLDDPSSTMIWEGGNVYMQILMAAETGIYREVMDTVKEGRLWWVSSTDHRKMMETQVVHGRHVLFVEEKGSTSIIADVYSETGRCDYYTSREFFFPNSMSMIGQKDHPLVPALSESIKYVRQFGIFDYWMKSFKVNSSVCLHPPTRITIRSSLGVSNLWGMFVVLAVGHVTALLLLLMELLTNRLIKTQRY